MKIIPQALPESITPMFPENRSRSVERELGLTDVVKMASNENPWASPLAVEAIKEYLPKDRLYPDGNSYYLKKLWPIVSVWRKISSLATPTSLLFCWERLI